MPENRAHLSLGHFGNAQGEEAVIEKDQVALADVVYDAAVAGRDHLDGALDAGIDGDSKARASLELDFAFFESTDANLWALQVEESVRTYSAQRPIRSTAIYGGVPFDPQLRKLLQAPEVVVATPGRLLDHVGQRTIDLSKVEVLVLDEADRMLDMGFIPDVRRIIELLPRERQTLLFSATFNEQVRRLAADFQRNPAFVQVTPRNSAPALVRQIVLPVARTRKREVLSSLIRSGRIEQALVFTRTKHGAGRLAEQLERDGIAATTASIAGSSPRASSTCRR